MNRLFALLFLLVPQLAFAEGGQGTPGMMGNFIFMGALLFFIYFMMIRPQMKKQKEHQNLIQSINNGDEVVTSGGILGRVVKVSDQFLVLALSDDINVTVQRQAIAASLPKGTMKNI